MHTAHQNTRPSTNNQRHLIFSVGTESFGVSVLLLRQILRLNAGQLSRLPNAPDYVRGVIDVGGDAVPIIDLRIKFECQRDPEEKVFCVVVLDLPDAEEMKVRKVGIVVDDVFDILTIDPATIKASPNVSGILDEAYVSGLINHGNGTIYILIDFDKLMRSDEMVVFAKDRLRREKMLERELQKI